MQPHSRRGRNWRRLKRNFGTLIVVGLCTLVTVAFVALLMYVLTSEEWRWRH